MRKQFAKLFSGMCLMLILSALFTLELKSAEARKIPTEKEMGAYLMVYHKDADHSLHMAVSYDGYAWKALNDDQPIISGDEIAVQHGIRDPHIFRGPDGGFYLAMTDLHLFAQERYKNNPNYSKISAYRKTQWERDEKYGWGNNRGLVLMKSFDLINWTRTNLDFSALPAQPGMDWSEVGCVWAPETVYDEEKKQLLVHFTTRERNQRNVIYGVYMNDDFTKMIGEPQLLFAAPDRKYNVIDSDIIKAGDTYHFFFVSHEGQAKPVHATGKNITGPYTVDSFYKDNDKGGHEAPNCWKLLNQDKYIVMFDNFDMRPNNFGFVETSDFKEFKPIGHFDEKESPFRRLNFMEQKHGAVVHLTEKEAKTLEAYWDRKINQNDETHIVFGTTLDPRKQMEASRELAKKIELTILPDSKEFDKHFAYKHEEAGEQSPFRVCIPHAWDGKTPLPMVLFLHGAWNTESSYLDQNDRQMVKLADQYGVLLVSPLGGHGAYGNKLRLPGMFGKDDENEKFLKQADKARDEAQMLSEKDVINVIEIVLAHYPVDRANMFIMGHSMGSGGTWHIGGKYHQYWKALAPFSGPFVTREGYPWDKLKGKSIFITEGRIGCPTTEASRALYRYLQVRHYDVKYKDYQANHPDMVPLALPDVFDFIKEQIKKNPESGGMNQKQN